MARTTDVKLEYTLLRAPDPFPCHHPRHEGGMLLPINPVPSSNTNTKSSALTEETLKSPIQTLYCSSFLQSSPPRPPPSRSDSIPNAASASAHAPLGTTSLRIAAPRRTCLPVYSLPATRRTHTLTPLERVSSPAALIQLDHFFTSATASIRGRRSRRPCTRLRHCSCLQRRTTFAV